MKITVDRTKKKRYSLYQGTYNGDKCYYDESLLYMIKKDKASRKWCLYRVHRDVDTLEYIELHPYNKYNTLYDAEYAMEAEIIWIEPKVR